MRKGLSCSRVGDSTVSFMLSGLETRSLGLNTLDKTWSPASSQFSEAVVRPRLPGFTQYQAVGKCDNERRPDQVSNKGPIGP